MSNPADGGGRWLKAYTHTYILTQDMLHELHPITKPSCWTSEEEEEEEQQQQQQQQDIIIF